MKNAHTPDPAGQPPRAGSLTRETLVKMALRIAVVVVIATSIGYFHTEDEPFGVHPLLRVFPPRRALSGLEPEHLLFGHGPGYHGAEAPRMLREALATSRRRLPRTLRNSVRR